MAQAPLTNFPASLPLQPFQVPVTQTQQDRIHPLFSPTSFSGVFTVARKPGAAVVLLVALLVALLVVLLVVLLVEGQTARGKQPKELPGTLQSSPH